MRLKYLHLFLFAALLFTLPTLGTYAKDTSLAVPLWPEDEPKSTAKITVHHPKKPNGAAVVICPGGGYGMLVRGGEGHGIAKWLNTHGITGIVLEYELPKGRPNVPLNDALRTIRTARSNAKDWKIAPDRIGIIGFSAGGHLASAAGTHFDLGDENANDPIEQFSARPDFMILVYPVISMGEKSHRGSRRNLLGKEPTAELIEKFSSEKQVTKDTPPAYLAHAQDDKVVVPDNSAMFHAACQKHDVQSTYLKLPSGGHGLNGYKGPMWDAWQSGSIEWLVKLKMIPQPHAE
ncbi:MAG: alpha/beta hydrolase [Phycisphaeraceae bacterium]